MLPAGFGSGDAMRVVTVREATRADGDVVWRIFQAVIAPGDTYVFDPGMSREAALDYWFRDGNHVFVAAYEGRIVGTYLVRANQPDLGSHVSNAAFMVDPTARGLGVGQAMGVHALQVARELGFLAMQFNFVVSTNTTAVRLWERLGFRIVGTLPAAFRHATLGYVDAFVMFRNLT